MAEDIQNSKSPDYVYAHHLKNMGGIPFTRREIDILAGILSGKTVKTIAHFLTISPKTVDTYIRKLMLKLNCNSRESIINFIEKTGNFFLLRQHYENLLFQAQFEKKLWEMRKLIAKEKIISVFLYAPSQKEEFSLSSYIENQLNRVGIQTTRKSIADTIVQQKSNRLQPELDSPSFIIYIATSDHLDHIQNSFPDPSIHRLIIFSTKENASTFSTERKNCSLIIIEEHESYQDIILEILKNLFPQLNIDHIRSGFQNTLHLPFDKKPFLLSPSLSPSIFSSLKNDPAKIGLLTLKKKKIWALAIIFCGLSLGGLLSLLSDSFTFGQAKERKVLLASSIYSDLPLPQEMMLLQRPKFIRNIRETFKTPQEIETVALVGIGGAGKTTLARQYALTQNLSLVWEINAETRESLIHSFENLAYALSQTDEDRRILSELQQIKDSQEKEEKIILFVKKKMKAHSPWLLIFDNVENFPDLKQYFPSHPSTWGKGNIIITTRDSNIQNNSHVTHTLHIGELDPSEKLALFEKIMTVGNKFVVTEDQKRQAEKLLTYIPSFPLDISIATNYLKATNQSFESYVNKLIDYNKDFLEVDESTLIDSLDYPHTRYSIIKTSLKKIIDKHPDFADLLLFISLLDSQNIPRHLLTKYKNEAVVDNLIYNLKKYSLIITVPGQKGEIFSIHRSNQSLSLAYLTKTLSLETSKDYLKDIIRIFGNEITEGVNGDDLIRLKNLLTHCKAFMSHADLLTNNAKASLSCSLGCIYYCLSYYEKAQNLLEETLSILDNFSINDYHLKARTLVYLGIVVKTAGNRLQAKNLIEKGLDLYKNQSLDDRKDIAWALLNLGDVYRNLGDYDKAKTVLEQSLLCLSKNPAEDLIQKARVLLYLGTVYRDQGNYEKAKDLLEESLTIYKKYFPPDHLRTARTLGQLANLCRELGHFEQAEKLALESTESYKRNFSDDHIDVGWALVQLGRVYMDIGKYIEARDVLEQSLIIHKKFYHNNHIEIAWVSLHLANAYKELNQYEKAKDLLHHCLDLHTHHFGKDHPQTADALMGFGGLYLREGDMETAHNYFQQALKIYQKHQHFDQYKALENLAELHLKRSSLAASQTDMAKSQTHKKQALHYFTQALKIIEKNLATNSFHTQRLQSKIKNLS